MNIMRSFQYNNFHALFHFRDVFFGSDNNKLWPVDFATNRLLAIKNTNYNYDVILGDYLQCNSVNLCATLCKKNEENYKKT